MEDNIVKFDKDTPAIVAANKVQSVMAVNKDTGEVGNVAFDLLVQEAGKNVADAVKVTGNVLPTLGNVNKRYSFTTDSTGRTLTYGGASLVYAGNKQCSAFWDGTAKTWTKEDEVELPKVPVKNEYGNSEVDAASQKLVTILKEDFDSKIKIGYNREYILCFLDGEDKVLGGFKRNGDFNFNNDLFGVLKQHGVDITELFFKVTANLNAISVVDGKVTVNTNAIASLNSELSTYSFLKNIIIQTQNVRNSGWLFPFIDGEGKIVFGAKKDGDFQFKSKRIDDLDVKLESATGEIIKINNTLKLITNRDWLFALIDGDNKVVFGAKKSGDFRFNSKLLDEFITFITNKVNSNELNITGLGLRLTTLEDLYNIFTVVRAWGDSLTAGGGNTLPNSTKHLETVLGKLTEKGFGYASSAIRGLSSNTYLQVIEALIADNNFKYYNHGIGGESMNTILARQGAIPAIFNQDILIPSNTADKVLVGNITDNTLKSQYDNSNVTPLRQGNQNQVNPMVIEGVECTLSLTNDNYYLSRNKPGREILIKKGTPIYMTAAKIARITDIAIIWCFQNGGYSTNEDLVYKLNRLIDNLGTDKYLILGLHTGTEADRNTQETLLAKTFGQKFFNWRRYVSQHALFDWGLTPTKDTDFTAEQLANGVKSDTYQMGVGALPSSFWQNIFGQYGATSNDVTHLTRACNVILGFKIYELFKTLGYIK